MVGAACIATPGAYLMCIYGIMGIHYHVFHIYDLTCPYVIEYRIVRGTRVLND